MLKLIFRNICAVHGQYCVPRATDFSSNTAAKIDRQLRKNLRCEMSTDGWKVQMLVGSSSDP